MNTLFRTFFAVILLSLWGMLAHAADMVHDHQHGMATSPVPQNEDQAALARLQKRMDEIVHEGDRVRRLQLMELQMRDMEALADGNPNGEACHMKGKTGVPGMSGMGRTGGMMGTGQPHEHCMQHSMSGGCEDCPMHKGRGSNLGAKAPMAMHGHCEKCEATQQRLKVIEQRLDILERTNKPNPK